MSWITNALAYFGKKRHGSNGVYSNGHATVFDGGFTQSKGPKNFDEAMVISAVFKCGRIIGETFGSFKGEYLKLDDKGNAIPYVDHKLYGLIKLQPNPLYTSFTYFETALLHVAICGNHYAYINTDGNGEIVSLDLLNPEQMVIFVWDNKIWYRDQSTRTTYSQDEILHVKGPSKDGVMGMTPIQYVSNTFAAAGDSSDYVASVYANGSFIGGVLYTDKVLDDNQTIKLAKSWAGAYQGKGKAGKVAVLEDGVKFQEVKMSPQDLDIINTKKYSDSDISGLYRVPLHMINALDRSTNNNIGQQDIDFGKHCMRPYVKRFEQEYNRKLVPKDKQGKEFIRWNMDSLLRGDTKTRSEYYKTMYYIDSMTPNQIRKSEKMETIDNGDETYSEKMSRLGISNKNTGENGKQNRK